jgi:hypothetical protein
MQHPARIIAVADWVALVSELLEVEHIAAWNVDAQMQRSDTTGKGHQSGWSVHRFCPLPLTGPIFMGNNEAKPPTIRILVHE